MRNYGCEARQEGDQLKCHRCGLYWQMNDQNPPPCRTQQEIQTERNRRGIAELKRILKKMNKKVSPPIKYPGGKRFLVNTIRSLWDNSQSIRLVEPFSGAMAISLGIAPKKARLNDLNPHVINFYQSIQKGLSIEIDMQNQKEFYYARRNEFNSLIASGNYTSSVAASLFYYLNRTCFNGLVRFNASGLFNVPFGRYKNINYQRAFPEVTKTIRHWKFTSEDFTKVRINKTDFIYADPPYDTQFNNYSGQGFKWPEQERLIKHFKKYECPIVISNQATDRIIELYQSYGYKIMTMEVSRMISCKGNRESAKEILAFRNIHEPLDII